MSTPTDYPIHPLAQVFPELPPKDYIALVASIRDIGLLKPITLLDGHILDGRHRHMACHDCDVEPRYVELEGGIPAAKFVVAENIIRRHMTTAQLAVAAARIESLPSGQPAANKCANLHTTAVSKKEAAEAFGVSERSVATARAVIKTADAEVVDAMTAGTVSLNDAAKVATLPKRAQKKAVAKVQKGEAKSLSKAVDQMNLESAASKPKPKKATKSAEGKERDQRNHGYLKANGWLVCLFNQGHLLPNGVDLDAIMLADDNLFTRDPKAKPAPHGKGVVLFDSTTQAILACDYLIDQLTTMRAALAEREANSEERK